MVSQKRNERVLVTGGNGFVGYYVVKELRRRGYDVAVLDTASKREDVKATYYETDLRYGLDVLKVVEDYKPTLAVHLAAVHFIPYCNQHPTETYDVNVGGTHNLLQALAGKVKRIFLASSAAVYSPSEMPHSEMEQAWPRDIYGLTKKAMEIAALSWSASTGSEIAVGRYFNMYGWGETAPHLIPVLVSQLDQEHISLGNLETRRDFTHVKDNARATVDMLEMGGNMALNLGSGVSYSAQNILGMLAQIVGRDIPAKRDQTRMRQSDRPNLVADTTLYYIAGLNRPRIALYDGLADLVKTGVGPYLEKES